MATWGRTFESYSKYSRLMFSVWLCLSVCTYHVFASSTQLTFYIDENKPSGTVVGTIPNNNGKFILPVQPNGLNVNLSTGVITTTKPIDREKNSLPKSVEVLRADDFHLYVIKVVVNDLNDNSPKFDQNIYSFTFYEGLSDESKTIKAVDGDSGVNSTQKYSIISGNIDDVFTLTTIPGFKDSKSGKLTVNGSLDRENLDHYLLNVSAQDGGIPPRIGFALLNITVGDVNDNAPKFTSPDYLGFIKENATQGTSIVTVSATDADIGSNAEIEFKIDRSSHSDPDRIFNVDPKSGLVTNNLKLDYEKKQGYRIVVKAENNLAGSILTSSAWLTIKVLDLNDNSPVVTINYVLGGSYQVLERATNGTIVATIDVSDADSGTSGEVYVTLQDTYGYFQLQPVMNDRYAIKVASLIDREKIPVFKPTIVAKDKGIPSRTTEEPFIINVGDVNDNSPKFVSAIYRGSVSEDAAKGVVVLSVHATDKDAGTNAELVYNISNSVPHYVLRDWFSISPSSGKVRTSGVLDRENISKVVLTVTVSDKGSPPKSGNCTVIIDIRDSNDNDPYFNQSIYFMSVTENSPNGSYVGRVFASDNDVGLNSIITYHIAVDSKFVPVFTIKNDSGVVLISGPLDHESRTTYLFTVVASDGGGRNTTAEVNITVIDENDNSPSFSPTFYNLSYPENLKTGFVLVNVTATDKDSGMFAVLHYNIRNGNSEGLFIIDHKTGAISLSKNLDRETEDFHSLVISAQDGGGRVSTNFAIVNLTVTDINDNPPVFDQQVYNFSIVENAQAHSIIGSVHATSKDIGSNAEIFYSIADGNVGNTFAINKSGIIYSKTHVDREATPSFVLSVEARDGGNPPLYRQVNVTVSVIDQNDNSPDFNTSQLTVSIPENTKIGETFYTLSAVDQDSGENGRITYKILENPNDTFQVDLNSGKMSLKKTVSLRGIRDYIARVFAQDNGSPSRNTTVQLNLQVVDVNDHSPVFMNSSYSVEVNEATPANKDIIQVLATDKDTGANALITYSLHSKSNSVAQYFGIHSDGRVFLRFKLDREVKDIYYLTISAADHGVPVRTAQADLTVYVIDDNDNSPKFNQSQGYTFSIFENEKNGTFVGRLYATDNDIGTNALLRYKFNSPNTEFVLNSITGEIRTLQVLDREKTSNYDLMAVVSDSGTTPRVDKARVIVIIKDRNDNNPRFEQGAYNANVLENVQIGTTIVTVSAVDPDDGPNGKLTYSIITGDEHKVFQIDSHSGVIKTAAALDREQKDLYVLSVEARDNGIPDRSNSRMVYVNVYDVNDNHPIFTSNNSKPVYLQEKDPAGSYVTTVTAKDKDHDKNGQVWYKIVNGNIGDTFRINETSGAIYTTKVLDHEKRSRYQLEIQATDRSHTNPLHSTMFVIVHVRDSNDNRPTFQENPIFIHLSEGVPINTTVTEIKAFDADSKGPNSDIWFQINSQSPLPGPHFTIDRKTGIVYTTAEIDRESTDEFILILQATDQAYTEEDRLSSTATLVIQITDINDNKPKFTSRNHTYVMEDEHVQYPVMSVTAVDDDEGSNSVVEYGMANRQDELHFHLDKYTGLIKLIGQLDYEKQKKYVLNITAKDSGTPPLMSYQLFTILVVDVNDNPPEFNNTLYTASVLENENPGTFVMRLEATDRDSGTNAELTYSIPQGVDKDKFSINEKSGIITTNATLDHEGKKIYELIVYARDDAYPFSIDKAMVRIEVVDKNDNFPIFTPGSVVVKVIENHHPSSIHTMIVKDEDSGENKQNEFSIIQGNSKGHFAIDKNTGVLSSTTPLDRENISTYELVVQAKNIMPPYYKALANVTVLVGDEDDNKPVFSNINGSYNIIINELTPPGSNILNVSANDPDVGSNGRVTYSLSSDATSTFRVDSETGQIFTIRKFEYKKKNHYVFSCIATDQGLIPDKGLSQVSVHIVDENNHSPVFKQVPYRQSIPSDTTSGKLVLQVSATDGDAGTNAELNYSLTVSSDTFRLVPDTGDIYTKKQPANGRYILYIQAEDKGVPSLKGNGIVEIVVGNVSDIPFKFVNASPSTVQIPENSAKGFEFVKVMATGNNLQYSIVSGNHGNTFAINQTTGVLSVEDSSKLDYESTIQFELYIAATSTKSGSFIAYLKLFILLIDVNDNKPVFHPSSLNIKLLEDDGMSAHPFRPRIVTDVNATDADNGTNAQIKYSIESGNNGRKFEIDALTGVIKTSAILDREQQSVYKLVVKASNPGDSAKSQISLVTVTIVDVNDNRPLYAGGSASVLESANIGSLIARLNVTDEDQDTKLTYSFKNRSEKEGPFRIGKFSGVIYLAKALDYEKQRLYNLQIIVNDSLYTTEIPVNISVLDVNDNSPVFKEQYYKASISNDLSSGVSIIKVSATDKDSGTNGEIKYSIQISDRSVVMNNFAIDEKTGLIYTRQDISVSNKIQIHFPVTAKDAGTPPNVAFTFVNILIQKSIRFTQSKYQINVLENVGIGTSVLTVSATSAQALSKVSYTVLGSVPFRIGRRSGVIEIKEKLDFETKRNYTFYVEAKDGEKATARVDVYVQDVNDNAPVFTKSHYLTTVSENIPVGTSLFRFNATDRDSGQNSQIRFYIHSGDVKESFYLNSHTGVLTTAKSLDHDSLKRHNLAIEARDRGNPSKEKIVSAIIDVTDLNDNRPQFSVPDKLTVPEHSPVGTSVGRVTATDRDSGSNGKVVYSIVGGDGLGLFLISNHTGDITTNATFDFEIKSRYSLTIKAIDEGVQPLSNNVTVTLYIGSVDEHKPKFTKQKYQFEVNGDAKVGDEVGRVSAVDEDGGPDGEVYYSLGQPETNQFAVNRTSGKIYVNRTLDEAKQSRGRRSIERNEGKKAHHRLRRNADKLVQLRVQADSGREESLYDVAYVTITILFSPPVSSGGQFSEQAKSLIGGLASLAGVLILVIVIWAIIYKRKKRKKNKTDPPLRFDGSFDEITVLPAPPNGTANYAHVGQSEEDLSRSRVIPNEFTPLNRTSDESSSPSNASTDAGSSGRGSGRGGDFGGSQTVLVVGDKASVYSEKQNGKGSIVPDSGIQPDDDQISQLTVSEGSGIFSTHVDGFASESKSDRTDKTDRLIRGLESQESLHVFGDEGGGEADGGMDVGNLLYAKLAEVDADEDDSVMDGTQPYIDEGSNHHSYGGSLSSIVGSQEELSGSYNWDYLLNWGPQFQPLADVFLEIGRMKDEVHFHPDIMSSSDVSHRQPDGMRTTDMLSSVSSLPRTPISHPSTSYSSPALSPNFTPAITPLVTRSPSISPLDTPSPVLSPQSATPASRSRPSSTHIVHLRRDSADGSELTHSPSISDNESNLEVDV